MPGSTLNTAQNIGALTSFSINDAISTTNFIDYYKFSLTATKDIQLILRGITQDSLYVSIYQDKNNNGLIDINQGEQLYYDNAYNSQAGSINATLGVGSYYIGIQQGSVNVNSSYSLQLSSIAAPPSISINPGNTILTSYNIGSLTGIKNFREFVGNSDPVDYYKFSLVGTSDFQLLLNGITQSSLYTAIYQDKNNNGLIDIDQGEQLYYDNAYTSQAGSINATLGTGTYYIGVQQGSENINSNYSLQLSSIAAPPSISTNPGNTILTSYNIGSLTGIKNFREFVGNSDLVDYYKFSLANTSDVQLLLNGITQSSLYTAIYQDKNNNGLIDTDQDEQLYYDNAYTSQAGSINATLGAGTYYIGVQQGSENINSNYSLQLSSIAAPPSISTNPGNTILTSYNIGSLTGIKNFREFVGNSDLMDYYKFSLASTSAIQLLLNGITQSSLYTAIYQDKNNNGLIDIDQDEQLYYDYAYSSQAGSINATLGAGTYYIGVQQGSVNINSNYSLQLVNNTIPSPSNTISLSVAPAFINEDGANSVVYTFTRTGSAAGALAVKYTGGGTATFNTDYTINGITNFNGTSGTVTFAAGSNTATLVLAPKADVVIESNETIALTLAAGSGYTIGTTTAVTSTIVNDDSLNRSGVSISLNDITVVEGKDGNALLTVSLSGLSNQPISVNYTTTAIGATAGTDYITKAGVLVIPPNSLNGTISIPIINDNLNEVDESFLVTLSSPVNATINPAAGIAEVTITDTMKSAITRVLPSGVENLILIGAGVINGIGNAGSNRIVGNIGNNQINGGAGADTLSGASGNDTFVFQLGQSTVSAPDRITDFTIGADKIDLLSLAGTAVNAPVLFSRAGDSTATTLVSLATQVFTDANGAIAGNQGLGVNSATLVKVNAGAIAGFYLVINDNVAGFQSNNDLLINITGTLGTVPAVGNILPNSFFV